MFLTQMAPKWLNWFINGSQGTEYTLRRHKDAKADIYETSL